MLHLLLCRLGILLQLAVHAHDEARRAEATLGAIVIGESLLDWVVGLAASSDALNGGDVPPHCRVDGTQTLQGRFAWLLRCDVWVHH